MMSGLQPKGTRTLRKSSRPVESSTLIDNAATYGWISILLHWLTAVAIIAIWIIGKSILNEDSTEVDARRALHVSVAGLMWLVVLFRIVWRFRSGHPRVRGLTTRTHYLARSVHYVMLVLLIAMLISGPVMVWADGHAIVLFDSLTIPPPFAESEPKRSLAWTLHSQAAIALASLVILHIAAALKHLMFHSDDTIIRMLWPEKNTENQ